MNLTMQRMIARVAPYFALGVLIVVAILGFIFLSYILIIGLVIGLLVYAGAWVRRLFTARTQNQINPSSHQQSKSDSGRTIDYDDLK